MYTFQVIFIWRVTITVILQANRPLSRFNIVFISLLFKFCFLLLYTSNMKLTLKFEVLFIYNLLNVSLSGYAMCAYSTGKSEDASIPILIFKSIAAK